jgi:hypothetical protein
VGKGPENSRKYRVSNGKRNIVEFVDEFIHKGET